jgi:hypothetical protein
MMENAALSDAGVGEESAEFSSRAAYRDHWAMI